MALIGDPWAFSEAELQLIWELQLVWSGGGLSFPQAASPGRGPGWVPCPTGRTRRRAASVLPRRRASWKTGLGAVSLRGPGAGQCSSWGPWESGGGGPPQTALCQFRPVPGGRGSSFWWDQSWDPGFSSPEAKASLWPSDAFSICFSLSFPILKYS